MAQAVEADTAQRLRVAVMRLARVLRSTEAGLAADLTPTRVAVLLNAMRNSPVRLSDIADQEGLNPTLLSRTVANLGELGLLTRTQDPGDRRTAWLEITPAGRRLAATIRIQRTEAMQRALEALSASERADVESALPALERLFEVMAR